MKAVERKALPTGVPDFTRSGYIGTKPLDAQTWEAAVTSAKARQAIALEGDFQKVAKDPERQFQCDLKGTIAELGFGAHLSRVAEQEGIILEKSALVADAPDTREDVQLDGLRFDIKGCAGLVEGLTVRDDKMLIINCHQHNVKYKGYTGYFFVKSYGDCQDVFFFRREDVDNWERVKGRFKAGDYYAIPIPKLS